MGFGRNLFHASLAVVCVISLLAASAPITSSELELLFLKCDAGDEAKCRELEQADTSELTDLSNLFANKVVKYDLSRWNTSSVTNMNNLFYGSTYDGDISRWDTSKVKTMRRMFYGFYDWGTSTQMGFTGDISRWDTSSVTEMDEMFYGNTLFQGDISRWDTSKVTSMTHMFNEAFFNGDISLWHTSSVMNMNNMFQGGNFNNDLSKWKTSKVTSMMGMFDYNREFDQDLSKWNTAKVTNMQNMFYGAVKFNQDVSRWDMGSVRNVGGMFVNSGFDGDLCGWNMEARFQEVSGATGLIANGALFGCQDSCKDNTRNQDTAEAYADCGGTFNCRMGCLASCKESRKWEVLGTLEEVDEMRTGGLGKLIDGTRKVWMCLHNTTCVQSVAPSEPPVEVQPDFAGSDAVWGTADDLDWADWMCYKFNEVDHQFELWGLESDLRLWSPHSLPE